MLGIELSEHTLHTNLFLSLLPELRIKAGCGNYTELSLRLDHVLDLPQQNRRYEMRGDPKLITKSSLGHAQAPAWRVRLKDRSRPELKGIVPFWIPAGARVLPRGQGEIFYLTQKLCPTIDDAREVYTILCNILNRVPQDIDEDCFELEGIKKTHLSGIKAFSEITACFHWKRDFDFTEWDKVAQSHAQWKKKQHSSYG
jgi:hypothetical protein